MADDWPAFLASLPKRERAAAERLAGRFAALGVPEPEVWARAEIEEATPHLARLLLLRRIWSEAIAPYEGRTDWIGAAIEMAERAPGAPFAEAGAALRRVLSLGADPADIGRVARMVAFNAAFDALHVIDEGAEPETESGEPGWGVLEVDGEGYLTDRVLDGLGDALLALQRAGGPSAADEVGEDALE